MAQPKRSPEDVLRTVTLDRAKRLYRLLRLLATGPQTRAVLMKRLRLDVRGFYRDLELLRTSGIGLPLSGRRYSLGMPAAEATDRLPFPDPRLTLAEAMQLAKGKSAAHRKLRGQIARIVKA
jgi:hypothetical protein